MQGVGAESVCAGACKGLAGGKHRGRQGRGGGGAMKLSQAINIFQQPSMAKARLWQGLTTALLLSLTGRALSLKLVVLVQALADHQK